MLRRSETHGFPEGSTSGAYRGWSRITSISSLTNENKLAGRRTVPVFGAACEFQVVPGPFKNCNDLLDVALETCN